MNEWRHLEIVRREYGELTLTEEDLLPSPLDQFKLWLEQVLATEKTDPTAMVLSTVDKEGLPDSRVVLLKGLTADTFIFYTSYQSSKGLQLDNLPYAALNFYWPIMARQVRVRGQVKPVSKKQSDVYFASRPLMSKLSAIASPQSKEIANRQVLEDAVLTLKTSSATVISRPPHWGGYQVSAEKVEFWQGRDNRLHDRICYFKHNNQWLYKRLAP